MVLDTNTGDKIYFCTFEKDGSQIKASVDDNKKKRTVLKPNASHCMGQSVRCGDSASALNANRMVSRNPERMGGCMILQH